jgi:hypothetical protein
VCRHQRLELLAPIEGGFLDLRIGLFLPVRAAFDSEQSFEYLRSRATLSRWRSCQRSSGVISLAA